MGTCDFTSGSQKTKSGRAFFNVSTVGASDQPSNMPAGFVVGIADNVPLMGGHAWDLNKQPPSSFEWVEPIWLMGPYDGSIVDYEPMIPLSFVVGENDKE